MKPSNTVRAAVAGIGAVLLDTHKGGTFGVNAVGAKIWQKLKEDVPVEQIVSEISAEFSVSRETVQEDVSVFLETLRSHELLQSTED